MWAVASSNPVSSIALVKIECAWNSLDKKLTANFLVETRTKLEELTPNSMVEYGVNRVQLSVWLQQSLIMVSHGMVCLGPQWSANICEVCWGLVKLQSQGIVHLDSSVFFFFYYYMPIHFDTIKDGQNMTQLKMDKTTTKKSIQETKFIAWLSSLYSIWRCTCVLNSQLSHIIAECTFHLLSSFNGWTEYWLELTEFLVDMLKLNHAH